MINFLLFSFTNIVATKTQPRGLFEGTSSNPASMAFAFYAALWAYDGW